jgi:anti-sigma factor RsiW
MSDEDRSVEERDCGSDVAAYALGALEPAEAEAFRRHMESCAVCRDELATFQGVVNALPLTAPLHQAPPDLRRRVMGAVEGEPRARGDGAPAPRPRSRLAGWLTPRPALALGMAALLAVAVLAGVTLSSSSSPSARVVSAQVTGQGTAELRVTSGHGELVLHRFSPPPAGQIYEVWIKRPNHSPSPTSALFSVTTKGDGDVDVPGSLRGGDEVMVTPEPPGGTTVPTHPAVIQAQLT